MRYVLSRSCLAATLVVAFGSATAADGTITFTGPVTGTTCSLDVAGSNTKNGTVTLPNVSESALSAAEQVAGNVPFSIKLTGCTPATGNAYTWFESGATVNTVTGRLINSGTASNVEIQVSNKNAGVIKIGHQTISAPMDVLTPIDAAGTATLNYSAAYYATGVARAGTVSSTVGYSIQYP